MESLQALGRGSLFAGDYRIVEPLNAGGMGAVYVVDQISTGKQRALKVMHPQLVADPDLRRRFEQEARVGSKIDSEHVIEVQAAGVDGPTGMPWLSMELLRGEDLSARVARGPIPAGEVHAIFEQLCHAIGAAHAVGIVHRDLKPENIFLASSRRAGASSLLVKVLDFGIAKLSAEAGTRSTAAMGSPLWMAPEQTTRAAITPAADVWSLGLIAYHLLTGKHFWSSVEADSTLAQLLREIVLEPIPMASDRAAQTGARALVPAGFDAWFTQCVDREPAQRFANASAAWAALASVVGGTAAAPLQPVVPPAAVPVRYDGPTSFTPAPNAPTPLPHTAFATPAPHALEPRSSHAGTVLQPPAMIPTPPMRLAPPRTARMLAIVGGALVMLGGAVFLLIKVTKPSSTYHDDVVTICTSSSYAETQCPPCDRAQKSVIAAEWATQKLKTSEGKALLASIAGEAVPRHTKAERLLAAAREAGVSTCAYAELFDAMASATPAAPTTVLDAGLFDRHR